MFILIRPATTKIRLKSIKLSRLQTFQDKKFSLLAKLLPMSRAIKRPDRHA
jgi:hypothetical protein